MKTRTAGRVTFIEFHLVVPGTMTVATSHDICDRLEAALEAAVQGAAGAHPRRAGGRGEADGRAVVVAIRFSYCEIEIHPCKIR